METFTLILQILDVVAWPVTLFICVVILHRTLKRPPDAHP